MKYQLFVGENCHDCQKVQKTIIELGLKLDIKNLDKGDKAPMDLFILPALLSQNGELKAYGIDIIDYLKTYENSLPPKSWWQKLFG
jgi:hypothetical protein